MASPPDTPAPDILERFHPTVASWFRAQFEGPTNVQSEGWARIASGNHTLLGAPTGSGKTLAAFLWGLSELVAEPLPKDEERLRLLYISPLRALNYDIERNLRAPLAGIARHAELLGLEVPDIRVGVRTGDTPQRERRQQLRKPPDVFITTPESLYVMLTTQARELFDNVRWVIIDEIHALASSKRGTHLSISLERLQERTGGDLQRIGLSATQRPIERIAAFLGGCGEGRNVEIIEAPSDKQYDVQVLVPVEDMTAIGSNITTSLEDLDTPSSNAEGYSIWTALYSELLDHVEQHRSTIIFTNSRRLSERVATALNELAARRDAGRAAEAAEQGLEDGTVIAPVPTIDRPAREVDDEERFEAFDLIEPETPIVARAHHGSISREARREMEEQLKAGELPAIVATSSLELGIDMGAVDLVLHIESPRTVASGIQRIGRAGHNVGDISRARIYPKHRADLLECAAVAPAIVSGQIEPVHVPELALDVLSQQIVAIAAEGDRTIDDIFALVTRAWPYRELTREQLDNLLGLLAGYIAGDELADLRPRIVWDREANTIRARSDAARIAVTNAGTIPDRGLYGVFVIGGTGRARVGELDEEMVHETRLGDVIVLGASSWRVEEITRDRVLVTPLPGVAGKTPFWHGEGVGRSVQLGKAVGALVRTISDAPAPAEEGDEANPELLERLQRDYLLDLRAARNLARFVHDQMRATGDVPSDRSILVERFRDELGDWRICILTPYGKPVHGPWAMAIESHLQEQYDLEATALWGDDGIALRLPDTGEHVPVEALLPDPDEIEDLVIARLADTSLFASRFREILTRSLMMPTARFDRRSPLWLQRLKAHDILRVAQRYPSFPMILETYRECLRDVFDLVALRELLRGAHDRTIRVVDVETRTASPFAASLLFDYTASLIYEGDQPSAERRAQALALDQGLLRELLGTDDVRDLLEPAAIDSVGAELQRTEPSYRVAGADALHDLLRELGDLDHDEIALRMRENEPVAERIETLVKEKRIAPIRLTGEQRYVAIEDVGAYNIALGAQPPQGIPQVFLQAGEAPLRRLVVRYARTRTPFRTAELARRWGIADEVAAEALDALRTEGVMLHGGFLPGGTEPEWCDPDVLRRLRRRTLAHLRRQIEPIDRRALGRFLATWHGLVSPPAGCRAAVRDAIVQLEGVEASPVSWERDLLAARVANFRRVWLEELVHAGEVQWVGRGTKNGQPVITLYLADHIQLMAPDLEGLDDQDTEAELVRDALERQGASFLRDVVAATGLPHARAFDALWRLALAGYCTNDAWATLAGGPRKGAQLRSESQTGESAAKASASARSGLRTGRRSLRAGVHTGRDRKDGERFQGRWSLLPTERADDRERVQALSEALLDCYGVVTRDVAAQRAIPGGFAAVYRELSRQEEVGGVRRGYFVEGLGGAQFALPEAVDRLRALREPAREEGPVVLLRASDPAQPFGVVVPWPERTDGVPSPNRAVSNYVALRGGELLAVFSPSGKRLLSYDREALPAVGRALARMVSSGRLERVAIEQLDGEDLGAADLQAFAGTGFVRTPRGVQATGATVQAARRGGRGPGGGSANGGGSPGGGGDSGGSFGGRQDVQPAFGRNPKYGKPFNAPWDGPGGGPRRGA